MSATIVRTLDPRGEGRILGERLGADPGFEAHGNANTVWAYRGEGVVVCLYRSGKCVVQGAGATAFAERHLPSEAPALEPLSADLIGTDESGKGDYFGPLVAAAVLVPMGQEKVLAELGVKDSKQLSDGVAAKVAATIRAGYQNEVVAIGPARYNELYDRFSNLNALLAWATAKAVAGVVAKSPCRNVLSDKFGNERYIREALAKEGLDLNLTQRVRAEVNPAVAAASILARDTFLSQLARLGKEAGMKLPKGAGAPVPPVARRIYRQGGMDALRQVAKLHFKTTIQVTKELF